MFLETVLKNSIQHYKNVKKAWFRKQEVPIKILRKDDDLIYGKILEKANVDFYGTYQGNFYCLEAKQTNEKKFYTHQLKNHQQAFLNLIFQLKAKSILIIYFNFYNSFIKLNWNHFCYLNFQLNTSLKYEWFLKNGKQLELTFPGWLDFLE